MENSSCKPIKSRKKYKSNFLESLFEILEGGQFEELIHWDNDGQSFQIAIKQKFAETVLPMFFKHSNLSSFNRQLNMYSFTRKSQNSHERMSFSHPMFLRGRRDLVPQIPRKRVLNKKAAQQGLFQQEKSQETWSDEQSLDNQKQTPNKKLCRIKTAEPSGTLASTPVSQSYAYAGEAIVEELSQIKETLASLEDICAQTRSREREWSSMNSLFMKKYFSSNPEQQQSQGVPNNNQTQLPQGFPEFRSNLEKMLEFDKIDEYYDKLHENEFNFLLFSASQQQPPLRTDPRFSTFGNKQNFFFNSFH